LLKDRFNEDVTQNSEVNMNQGNPHSRGEPLPYVMRMAVGMAKYLRKQGCEMGFAIAKAAQRWSVDQTELARILQKRGARVRRARRRHLTEGNPRPEVEPDKTGSNDE
jgi:hypothetical protein